MYWSLVVIGILVMICIILGIKLILVNRTAKSIQSQLENWLMTDTNTLIDVSHRDKTMCGLAKCLNIELQKLRAEKYQFQKGNIELKEAITNISHDLRTPLTAIFGYLKLLQNEECSKVGRTYLAAIENRTKAMKQLTEELFQYTIIVSDTEEMKTEPINLNGILESCISSYYSVLKQNNIIPQITIPDKKIFGEGNENALLRILGNIISNAVKYSDGDLNIVLTENREFIFSNHASGLTEIQVERLFDRFYTVNNARKSTGLGLSISKALIEKMGGTITASYANNILTICIKV